MRYLATYAIFIILSSLFIASMQPITAQARNIEYVPLAPINVEGSEFTSTSGCRAPTCFPRYLRTLYNIGIAIAGLFAVMSIVRGAFNLVWTDSILGHSEAKGIILRAIGGLLIVYSSYILMNIASPSLGRDLDLSLNFPRTRIQVMAEPPLTLTEFQKQVYRQNVEKIVKEKEKLIADSRERIKSLEVDWAMADAAGDAAEFLRIQEEIKWQEEQIASAQRSITTNVSLGQAAEVTFGDVGSYNGVERSLNNATRPGGGIDKIRARFAEQRAGLTGNIDALSKSFTEEFERVAAIHDIAATEFINKGITDLTYGEASESKLVADVGARMAAIEQERTKQIGELQKLNQGTSDPAKEKMIRTQIDRINAISLQRTCTIRETCKKDYVCDIAPDARCTAK